MYSLDRLAELKLQREAESVFQTHSDERQQEAQEIRRLQQSRDARENREAQQNRPINRLAELKRQREAEDPQAHAEARAHRRQRIEEMKKTQQDQDAQRVKEQEARRAQEAREHAAQEQRRAQEAREHAAQEQRRAQEAHAARRAQEAQAARRAQEAQRVKEQEAQRAQRAREAQCAQDLEDAKELAEIQEYEALTRALAQSAVPVAARRVFEPLPPPLFGPSPLVASVAPASATLLQSAVESARQALVYADKVRRDIFLEEREQKLLQLALNHEGRMRAECERVDRGVTVAPIEYILGFQRPPRGGPEPVGYYRVLLGGCNLTFSSLPNTRNKLTGIQWETQFGGNVVPWEFWNPVKGDMVPEIDPDFQDDVFILPHFREEIATHLESHSLIHAANRENWFFLGPNMSGLDQTFAVTLKFLARMKKLNRLEFATISPHFSVA